MSQEENQSIEEKQEKEEEEEEEKEEQKEQKEEQKEEEEKVEEKVEEQKIEDQPKPQINLEQDIPPLQQRNNIYISSSEEDDDDDDDVDDEEDASELNEQTQSMVESQKKQERVIFQEVQQDEQANFMERIKEVEQEAQQKKEEARQEQERRLQKKIQVQEQEKKVGNEKLKIKAIQPKIGQKLNKLNEGINQNIQRSNSGEAQSKEKVQEKMQQAREQRSNTQQDEQLKQNIDKAVAIAGSAVFQANEVPKKEVAAKIVSEAASERKSEVYAKIRNWEVQRETIVSSHRSIVESLFSQFEKRIQISDNALNGVIKYYRERIENEEKYKSYHMNQKSLSKLFKQQEDKLVHVYYPHFTKTLTQLDDLSQKQGNNINQLIGFMQKQIKVVLEVDFINLTNAFKNMKDAGLKCRKTLSDSQNEVQKYYNKFQKLFQSISQKEKARKKATSKDFYLAEKKYKVAAYRLINNERAYGQYIMKCWYDVLKLEAQRLCIIQKSLLDFQVAQKECYGTHENVDLAYKLIDTMKPIEECELFYGIHGMLNQQELDYIKAHFQDCQKVTVQEVQNYLERFQIENLEESISLVYKKFKVKKDVGVMGRTWQDEEIVITVDYNLLMFDNPQSNIEKVPELKMKVSKIRMKQKKDEKNEKNLVEMQYEVAGVLLSSKKKMTLKFQSKDQLEEMKYFLETIGNHNFVTDL